MDNCTIVPTESNNKWIMLSIR